jgi:hypothetical protein
VPNEESDGDVARGRGLSNFAFAGERPPVIDQVSPPASIQDGRGAIQARVRDDGDLSQGDVWAIVYPPSFEEPEPSPDGTMPDLNLPMLDLSDTDGDGEFVGLYEGFNETGMYRVVVYAEDAEGNLSQPVAMEIPKGVWPTMLPSVTKYVVPKGEVAYGERLTYTLVVSAPNGVQAALYDPLTGTVFSHFLTRPDGVAHEDNVIAGTLTVTPTNQVTVSFVAQVEVPETVGWTDTVTNQACVYPFDGSLGGCVWSNEVINPAFQPHEVYLPLVLREK